MLDRLANNPFPTPYLALKGNHEALLAAFLEDPVVGLQWRTIGGLETLHSYGVPVKSLMIGKNYEEAAAQLRAALPAAHLAFIRSLKCSYTHGKYFICHAGVRPGVPLERQRESDLIWIRDEFLRSKSDFGKIVVHGHTTTPEPEVLPNRINIYTGAFADRASLKWVSMVNHLIRKESSCSDVSEILAFLPEDFREALGKELHRPAKEFDSDWVDRVKKRIDELHLLGIDAMLGKRKDRDFVGETARKVRELTAKQTMLEERLDMMIDKALKRLANFKAFKEIMVIQEAKQPRKIPRE